MARTRLYSILVSRLEDAVNMRSGSISAGDASSYEAYRESVGYIRGLLDAIKIAEEIESEDDQ